MDTNRANQSEQSSSSEHSIAEKKSTMTAQERLRLIVFVIVAIIVIALLITGAIFLLRQPADDTSHIRDIFIIFMGLEFMVIGLALIILIIQLASLTNLLQNEIKPVLEATNDTVNTLRGTATFLSDNVTRPVIKANTYVAALRQLIDLVIRPGGR